MGCNDPRTGNNFGRCGADIIMRETKKHEEEEFNHALLIININRHSFSNFNKL